MIRTRVLRSRLSSMVSAMSRAGVAPAELLGASRRDGVAGGEAFIVNLGHRSPQISDPGDGRRIARYLSFLDRLGRGGGALIIWGLEGKSPEAHEVDSVLALGRRGK